MFVELSNFWIIVLNVLGIPLAHVALSIATTLLPSKYFKNTSSSLHPFLEDFLHNKVFFTRKWKKLLPDAAPWMGGFPKGHLHSTEPNYLHTFVAETKRGELSHWGQLLTITAFTIWNPWPASLVIVLYALLSNLPCILNLRFTRLRLLRVLDKLSS